jgi:tetratricopeptide (TPR) repeat protein
MNSKVGPFRIDANVGRGSYGSVYRARESSELGRAVALKIVRPRAGRDALPLALREARALDRLVHPSIARVLGAGDAPQGAAYIATDFVDGPTLSQWCRDSTPSLDARLSVMLDVCAAMQYAHEHGTIHRDIKPSNVMIARESTGFRGVVIDFGVAVLFRTEELGAEDSLASSATFGIGTIETMAPEQCTIGALADVRSDLYSIGATLYWVLTGHAPFERAGSSPQSLAQLVERIRTEPLAALRVRGFARGIRASSQQRADLDAILAKTLAKKPEDRYRSVAELAEDLRSVRGGRAPIATAPGLRARTWQFARRHRGLVAVTATVAAILAVASAISLRFAWQEREARQEMERARADQEQAVDALRNALKAIIKDVRAVGDAPQLLQHWPSVIEALSRTYGPTHGSTMAQRYRYAEYLVTSKKYKDALAVLGEMEAIAIPEKASVILACVRFRSAQCYEGLGDNAKAFEVLEKTLAEDYPNLKPCDISAHPWSAIALRGRLLCALGRTQEGISELRRAVKVQAECHGGNGSLNDTQARGVLFEALVESGSVDEALVEIESLLRDIEAKGSTQDILVRVWVRRLESRRLAILLERANPEDRAPLVTALRATAIDWMRYSGLNMDLLRDVNRALEAAGAEPITKDAAEVAIRRLNAFTSAPPSL